MQSNSKTYRSMRRSLLGGAAVAGLLAFGIGGWAATAELSGAVIAPGSLVVDSNVKKVQHPTGGVVSEIKVREGDPVKAGDVVVRLDDTQTRANLAIVTKSLDELAAKQARDEAEQDGTERIVFPADLLARTNDLEVARVVQGEQKLFEIRRAARDGQSAQFKERIAQLREQISGLTDQLAAKRRELALVFEELKGVRELWQKNLIQIGRMTALERDAARVEGERGTLVSTIAQTKGRISETELQILQIDQDLRTEVGKDLAEIRAKTSELVEKKVAAEDQLKRVDIRAPQNGKVHQLTVHTVGGVITPGAEPIMLIVPEADALTVEAKIQPQDIDQVRIGQKSVLRFSAFNQRTTPELIGEVRRVSADVSQDVKSGAAFYTIRISVPASELDRLKGLKLVPGMPVESFIQTGDRTAISYLTKPLQDQVAKAWREK
ncbi:HlyD family type I secretion periplasmic adaptor subunit [Methylobacterium mesophilicum]